MSLSAVIMDSYGVLVQGKGNTKSFFYEYVKDKLALPKEELIFVYNKYRHRAFVDPLYSYERAMRDVFQELGIESCCAEYLQQNAAQRTVVVKEGVVHTLQELQKRNILVYVLTDCVESASWMQQLFAKLGIGHLICGIISSKDIGAMKPSPDAFQAVLDAFNLSKEEVLFVGHAVDELQGAHAFGITTLACFFREEDRLDFLPSEQKLSALSQLLQFQGIHLPNDIPNASHEGSKIPV